LADQRITQLTALPKAGVAATDVLPIADISASQTKKVTAKDLVDAGLDLIDVGSIDIDKLDQASTTKLGTTALADDAVTAAKLANDSSIAVQTAAPASDNFEGRGYFDSSSGNLQVFYGSAYSQVVMPTAGIGDLQVTTGKLADGAVTTAKVTALGTAAYADSSVTTAKIADDAITSDKINGGAVIAAAIGAGAVTTAKLDTDAVTYDKIQNVSATDRLLGRSTAGAGSVEEITCTAAGRALLDDADAATQRATLGLGTISTGDGTWTDGSSFSGTSSGTNTGDQTITLTGDVTGTGTGSFATAITTSAVTENAIATGAVTTGKILDDAVTAAKLADSSAAVVAAASPSGTGAFIGQQWFNTNNGQEFTWTGSAWVQQAGIGTINIVDSTPIALAVSYPDAYSATLTATLDTQAAATVFSGPTSGTNAAPTFRAIVPGDLPDATASTKGIIQPGTGLAIDAGTLNHANTVTGATVSSITFDNQGHITAAIPLVAADIPELDASKITTGEFPTARLADASITGLKIADSANVQFGETLPVAEHIGQFFFNPLEGSVFLWDGNVWQPVGVTTGAIILAGTYNATTNQLVSTTLEGAALGLTAGSPLPSATDANANYYVVVSVGGTGTAPAPTNILAPPDLILSTGTAWVELDVSGGAGAIAAVNVVFSAVGPIGSTNVQGAIEEVSTECRNATNITSGTLAVARGGTGLASYAKGDLVAATAATTLAKLTVGTNGQVLKANSSTATGLEWGAISAGTVTSVSSSTAALTVATATTTPALTVRSATTSLNGIVQLSNSTSTTSSVLAATPTAVKSAYDLAALALPKAGGTVTGDITLGANVGIQFEGTTDDANEIRLIGADATADRTITLPNVTGTVVTTGDNGTVTSAMIADGAIVNNDINASAAIALSKLATGALPTAITVASANIVNGTIADVDINASAAIADTKLATISTAGKVSNSATTATNANTASAIVARDASGNFSAGTITANLSGTASNVTTNANLTGDVTSVGNATAIAAGVIVNADINASAAIALSKLATGALPTAITVASANIVNGTIVNANINASAAIADTKLATISTAGKVADSALPDTISSNITGNAATVTTNANLTGDVTSVGNATAIAAGVIVNADINASAAIAGTKISPDFGGQNVTIADKIIHGGDTNTAIRFPAADTFTVETGGVERVEFGNTEVVFNDVGATVDFRIEGDTRPNLFKIDAGLDQVQVENLNGGPLAGFRNAIINGNFDHWQRGTSFTGSGYGADRWINVRVGSACTMSRISWALGGDPTGANASFACRMTVSSVANAANAVNLTQRIENVRSFSGQTVTVSFWAKADAAKPIALDLAQAFGTGGSPSASVDGIGAQKFNLTTSWAKYTATISVPSISGKTLGSSGNDYLSLVIWFDAGSNFNARTDTLGQQSGTFDIAQVQVEAGPVATPFERRPIGTELALCQRYYFRMQPGSGNNAYGLGFARTNTANYCVIPFPVVMRGVVSAVETTGTATDYGIDQDNGGIINCNAAPSFLRGGDLNATINFGIAAGTTTGGHAVIATSRSSNSFLGFSAEL
jgi:hypothetical protein